MNINYKCLDIQRILRYLRSLSLTSPSILSPLFELKQEGGLEVLGWGELGQHKGLRQ